MALLNISIALSRLPLKGQVSGYSGHCLCADWQPSVNLTFEPRWFPSFHRQSHIYCRSQWPYWWGLNPRQGLVSTEAVTNWTAADQWATDFFKYIYLHVNIPFVNICGGIVWLQFNTPIIHLVCLSKLLLICQSLKKNSMCSQLRRLKHSCVCPVYCYCYSQMAACFMLLWKDPLIQRMCTMSRTNGCLFCTWA